ncbi:hypothetical protein JCM16303_000600 [Sporobolomyces ruberrimus]
MSSPPPAKATTEGYEVEPASPRVSTTADSSSEVTSSTSSPPLSPSAPNPTLAPLRALFPETSDEILEAILEAHAGDLQAATESLLDLNNPDFRSEPAHQEEMEQIDLDAELARQLAEEDQLQYRRQQEQRRQAPAQREPQQPSQPVPLTYQAYVPKRRRGTVDSDQSSHGSWAPPSESSSQAQRGQQRPLQEEDERDELDVLADNFSKLAEQGKKSFGSFLSRMKEQVGKLDDMIQQSASPSTSERPPQPPPKSTPSNFGSARTGAQWSAPDPLPRPANAPPRTSATATTKPPNPRETLHRQDTNDSFTIGDDTDHSPNPSPDPRQPIPLGESIDSYFSDFDSRAPPEPPIKLSRNDPTSPPEVTTPDFSKKSGPAPVIAKSTEESSNSLAPPTKDPRKDFSKIGLLPRRSVSLLDDDKLHRSSTSGANSERIKSPLAHPAEKKQAEEKRGGNESDNDSDELEYVKNPFDED